MPFVNDSAALRAANSLPLLGLFAEHHLPWEIDRTHTAELASRVPSLAEMARKAVELLSGREDGQGFFLPVEGSKIDKAAHPNDAASCLHEVLAYDDAVGAMLEFAAADGQTLVVSTSDHETGGLALGRQPFIRTPSANIPEAPMRTRSLIGESEGAIDREYSLHPHTLAAQRASTEAMTDAARRAVGSPTDAALAADATLRTALVDALTDVLRVSAGIHPLHSFERAFVVTAVELLGNGTHPLGSYGVRRALGSIISARAKIGWSTFGHTGADVLLHAVGPGSDRFRGPMENSAIGANLADMMGFNLARHTAQLGTPLIAEYDRVSPANAPYAWWPADGGGSP